jgi:hypothetical protein
MFRPTACLALAVFLVPVPRLAAVGESETIQLPPMIVETTTEKVRWLYASGSGTEFLSRCSVATTRRYAESWLKKMQLLRTLVPPAFLAQMDVPAVIVLYAQDLKEGVSPEIQRQLRAAQNDQNAGRAPDAPGSLRINYAPNLRLNDRDMHASFVYIDEARFDAKTLIVAPKYLRYLLERRVPLLPAWLVEGVDRTYVNADLVKAPITFPPFVWIHRWDSEALARDAQLPRALLPAVELFSPRALSQESDRHPRRVEIMTSQVELFFRWAVDSGGPHREALWKFAERAAVEPVTEELFEACFGFGFSELRDRLSDYLPRAVRESPRTDPGRLPPLPPLDVRPATPHEIARLRGEWERLAIAHVQRDLPQVRELYAEQARRTLRKAFEAGDRDPRLRATMGLCEIDAGNEAGAREFLEPAIDAGVVRPRAYFEVARLRFAELRRAHPTRQFTYAELAPVFAPLRQAATQAPPLPEVYTLFAEAWVRSGALPAREDWALLETGARYFPRRPAVAFPLALAFASRGLKSRAEAILAAAEDYIADDTTRTRFAELRAILTAPAKPADTR